MFRLDSWWVRSSNIQLFQWNSVFTMLDSSSSSDVSSPVVPSHAKIHIAWRSHSHWLQQFQWCSVSSYSSGHGHPLIHTAWRSHCPGLQQFQWCSISSCSSGHGHPLIHTAWRPHRAGLQRLQWPVSVFVPHSRCSRTRCRVETPPLLLQSRCREGCYHDNRRDVTSALRKQRIILTGPSQLTHTPVCRLQHSTSIVCQVNKHRLHWLVHQLLLLALVYSCF